MGKQEISNSGGIESATLQTLFKQLMHIYSITETMRSVVAGDLPTSNLKFTVDGHLLGTIGVCIATYMFNLKIEQSTSNAGYDAVTKEGRKVEIKIRKSAKQLHVSKSSFKVANKEDLHLLVFVLSPDFELELRYNGLLPQTNIEAGFFSLNKLPQLGEKPLKMEHSIDEVNEMIKVTKQEIINL